MTINQLRNQRVEAFKELKRALKKADSSLEVAERFINSVITRKNKIPTAGDLDRVTNQLRTIDDNINTVINVIITLTGLFGAF